MEFSSEAVFELALVRIQGTGLQIARQLLISAGSASAVFRMGINELKKVPLIGPERARLVKQGMEPALQFAERELNLMKAQRIRYVFVGHADYPLRLRECPDAPLVLFYRGKPVWELPRILAVVGTRRCTDYGRQICREWIESLADPNLLILSGLAYGIDAAAHEAALQYGLNTMGVMGHGLNKVYPWAHRKLAGRMENEGAVMSEYFVQDEMMPHNFPMRNRIVAGLCDALLVVESDSGGGAMITAQLASSYNKQVFALPGRINDTMSRGCLDLVRTHKAMLCTSAAQLAEEMNWTTAFLPRRTEGRQMKLALGIPEENVLGIIQREGVIHIDKIIWGSGLAGHEVSKILLELELDNLIIALPGSRYRAVS